MSATFTRLHPVDRFVTFPWPQDTAPIIERIRNTASGQVRWTPEHAAAIFVRLHSSSIRHFREIVKRVGYPRDHWYIWGGERWDEVPDEGVVRVVLSNFLTIYGQAAELELGGNAGRRKHESVSSYSFIAKTHQIVRRAEALMLLDKAEVRHEVRRLTP